jgi:hypothetical protein
MRSYYQRREAYAGRIRMPWRFVHWRGVVRSLSPFDSAAQARHWLGEGLAFFVWLIALAAVWALMVGAR